MTVAALNSLPEYHKPTAGGWRADERRGGGEGYNNRVALLAVDPTCVKTLAEECTYRNRHSGGGGGKGVLYSGTHERMRECRALAP